MPARPREKVWVVRAGDGSTVAAIVQRAGETSAAVEAGRVFVGKKRAVRADQPVRVGDVVRIGPPAVAPPEIEILFQQDGVVAAVKPAGLPTVPDHASASDSLVALVAKAVGAKPGDLRVTSRLDRDVSGVVLFALDEKAEARLREARAAGSYHRRYVALAAGELPEEGVWDAPIGRAPDPRLRAPRGTDAKPSTTRWRRVSAVTLTAPSARASIALLAVDPLTGRTHQIRVHASDAGAPLVGDRDYGGPTRITLANGRILALPRIALHAARVSVAGLTATAPIPTELKRLWESLGGEADAWTSAVTGEMGR